eukprot:560487_1
MLFCILYYVLYIQDFALFVFFFFFFLRLSSTKGRENIKIKNKKHPIFKTLHDAYNEYMAWRNTDQKRSLNVRTFAAISSIYFGLLKIAEIFFDRYGENNGAYICSYRLTTNEVEGLFNEVRGNDHDNLPQYGNTLASKSVFSDAKAKLQTNDPMDIDNTNTNKTTKEYRRITANVMINKANATD